MAMVETAAMEEEVVVAVVGATKEEVATGEIREAAETGEIKEAVVDMAKMDMVVEVSMETLSGKSVKLVESVKHLHILKPRWKISAFGTCRGNNDFVSFL